MHFFRKMEAGEIMEIRQQVRLNQWSAMVREREASKRFANKQVLPQRHINAAVTQRFIDIEPQRIETEIQNHAQLL